MIILNEPHRMVVVNLICSAAVLIGVLFYKFIYPKKKINLLALLLIVAILPITSVFRIGDYESGDFNIHIYRMMSFFNSLREGILMPSWAGDLNATYGNPLFIFNYLLPYYAICLLHFLGISFIAGTKLYLGLVLYFSAIFMYLFTKELLGNKLAAFSSAIFYLFAPYHLIDVHFRATLGESTIFCIAPLLFLFIVKYFKDNKLIYLALITIFVYLLFLAHPLLAGVLIGSAALFIIFNGFVYKNTRSTIFELFFILIGILISGYVWAQYIIFSPYMFHYQANGQVGFYPFSLLFYSPWRLGFLFQGPKGELATIIGYSQLFIIITSLTMFFTHKFSKEIQKQIAFWLAIFLTTLYMMSPLSNIAWGLFPGIGLIGPMLTLYSRLSLLLAFCSSIIAGYFVLHFVTKKKLINFLLILMIGSTILNWGHRRVIPEINDDVLRKNVPFSTITEGPIQFLDTKWADPKNPWFSEIPKNHLEILNGQGQIKEISRTSTKHEYSVIAQTNLMVRENTLYFPGWQGLINQKEISLFPSNNGIINAKLPRGRYLLTVTYQDIFIYKLLKVSSIIMIMVTLAFLFVKMPKKLNGLKILRFFLRL